MKNPKINLVAGRLSKTPAPGQSAYAKNRLGITLEDQAGQEAADTGPTAALNPAPTPVPIVPVTLPDVEEMPVPVAPPEPADDLGSVGKDIIRQLEMMLAPAPQAPADAAPADAPATPAQSWEMPSAPAPATTASPIQAPVSPAIPDKPRPRLEASVIWSDSIDEQACDRPVPAKNWLHYVKVASPAFGGLFVIALIWGVWSWVNTGATSPRQAAASLAPRPVAVTTRPAHHDSGNTAGHAAANTTARGPAIDDQYPSELPRPLQFMDRDDMNMLQLPEEPWTRTVAGPNETAPAVTDPAPVVHQSEIKFRDPPSDLTLSSIVKLSSGAAANINGRFIHIDETINGARLISIGKFTVEMELNNEHFILGFGEAAPIAPPETPTSLPAK